LRLVPVNVTLVPTAPLGGLKLESVGAAAVTTKLLGLVPVPAAVVTDHVPVEAEAGTLVVICVPEVTKKVAAAEPSLTAVAPVKFVPVSVTLVPTGPLAGLKPVIVAAVGAVTGKFAELVAVPPPVVTLQAPVAAPLGTVATIWVAELTV